MIIGIGIDTVEINRFTHWHTYSDAQLLRIFSADEIAYCRANPFKSAERFAARFAAREAFFKALSSALPHQKIPFLRACKAITLKKIALGAPELLINWPMITQQPVPWSIWISCSHSKTSAIALVILEKKEVM